MIWYHILRVRAQSMGSKHRYFSEIITIKDQQRERLSNNDSPDGDVNVVCNSRLFSLSLRRMVVRSFINSVVIIKAIVFSFLLFIKKINSCLNVYLFIT